MLLVARRGGVLVGLMLPLDTVRRPAGKVYGSTYTMCM
jgi:hypothetical protein